MLAGDPIRRDLQAHRATARVAEQPPASTSVSLPERTIWESLPTSARRGPDSCGSRGIRQRGSSRARCCRSGRACACILASVRHAGGLNVTIPRSRSGTVDASAARSSGIRPKQQQAPRLRRLLLPQGRRRCVRGLGELFAVHRHGRRRATSADVRSVSGCRRRRVHVGGELCEGPGRRVRSKRSASRELTAGWLGRSLAARAITSYCWLEVVALRVGSPRSAAGPRARRRRARGDRQWPSAASAKPAVE